MRTKIPLLPLDENPMLKAFPDEKPSYSRSPSKTSRISFQKRKTSYNRYQYPLTERRAKPRITPHPPSKLEKWEMPNITLLDDEENTLCNVVVAQWVKQYINEDPTKTSFVSPTIYCLTKLFEMKNMTAHLIEKHPFRVAVICDLFAKLTKHQQFSLYLHIIK